VGEADRYASLSDEQLQCVHAACEAFERGLENHEPIGIEDCIAAAAEGIRRPLFRELLAIELERKAPADRPGQIAEYHARFPDRSDDIERAFHEAPDARAPDDLPETIGRYRVENLLGSGAFGRVYLACDEQLIRHVAIKVPHASLMSGPADAERHLNEARMVANLDHPHIVPVLDVGSTGDCPCYIVSKYVDGSDLAARIKRSRLPHAAAAALVADQAEALHYAHTHGLVHRDVKPGNILIDNDDRPYLVDFGLALRDEDLGRGPRFAGTPHFMSLEQARGEGHRVDGRSDIYSLGAVFYELLVGRRTFDAETQAELLERITTDEPKPPRQIDDGVPRELERICLKALAKRASERYTTAQNMAEDLRQFLASDQPMAASTAEMPPTAVDHPGGAGVGSTSRMLASGSRAIKIVPKGLRAFDAGDAEFFLELLPGPRDRERLPESLRFWKTRIDEADADRTFPVGLMYGPSGCGKSSLVQAGLLPRLGENVIAVYVEAAAADTEARLLGRLRKRCPGLPAGLDVKHTLAAVRRGRGIRTGKKVLIVLDQFEQWLHAKKDGPNTELVQALRQCDGGRLQCLVLVRDDFWMAATRFMREVEVPLVEGHNAAAVDLFPIRHAERVLTAFGRAMGALPDASPAASKNQMRFLAQAVSGLAQDGKVNSVRLALFAQMMNGRTWTPATLKEVGGTEGIGVTFLEEAFSAATAPPAHRVHQEAARRILQALLPESGTDIKGNMRSYATLLEASGHGRRPQDFDDVIRLLDSEIRLITPAEAEGESSRDARYYQLTHDFLVPSLRDWLTRRQKETRRGRAALLLADRAAVWNARPDNRQLPTFWQCLGIRWLTARKNWTPPERAMMRRANRVHAMRGTALGLMLAGATVAGVALRAQVIEQRKAAHAAGLVRALLNAGTAQVPAILRELAEYRASAVARLRQASDSAAAGSREQLHSSLALLPVDATQVERCLYGRLLDAEPHEVPVIRDALVPHRNMLLDRLWAVVASPARSQEAQRLRAAAALANYDPESPKWTNVSAAVVNDLVQENPVFLGQWSEAFRPVKHALVAPLSVIFRDHAPERAAERTVATNLLADYAARDPRTLAGLLMDADKKQFAVIFPKLKERGDQGLRVLTDVIDTKSPPELPSSDERRDALAKRQANAAVALLRLRQPARVWPLLKHSSDPRLRSYLIHRLAALEADAKFIVARLDTETDLTIRRALLLSLGEYQPKQLSTAEREALRARLLRSYQEEPDAGLHAAALWLLRKWGWKARLHHADQELVKSRKQKVEQIRQHLTHGQRKPEWYLNSHGQTLVVVPGPAEFLMGSPLTEADRGPNETQHRRRIGRTFALASTPVTVEQFQRFLGSNPGAQRRFDAGLGRAAGVVSTNVPAPDCPIMIVDWYMAAEYCNWLSQAEALPDTEWCYDPNPGRQYAERMRLVPDYSKRTGYRLPTEAEWEYACRAGAVTSRSYGESPELLEHYAAYLSSSRNVACPVGSFKPNDWGLFDMHGNAWNWCQNAFDTYPPDQEGQPVQDDADSDIVVENVLRVLRGGSFRSQPLLVRSADLATNAPAYHDTNVGFRLATTFH
jgi:serine/threonine protein kinase/formylglycine-generating enzyme required for sulfatase activity